jgi:transcriptional regulator with XRE-family HTH domain
MEAAQLEPSGAPARSGDGNGAESPLARARLHRKLTTEEAARRAGIREEEVRWLEEGRVYRFASTDHALLTALLYATALGVDHREALVLAGRPVPPKPLASSSWPRVAVLAAVAAAALAIVAAVVLARGGERPAPTTTAQLAQALPPPWTIHVVVLNGSGDINYTRRVASRIGALGYEIEHVGRAGRFDYRQTNVYYPPRGEEIAVRLAKQLGVGVKPLPGGTDAKRLLVIVGPARGPDG